MNEHAYKTDDLIDFSAINAIPVITVDSALSSTSTNPVQNKAIYTALAGKQSTLTFDTSPKSGSSNPVTSGGIYTAISNKMDKVTSVGSSSKPIYINSSGVPTACSYSIGTAASYEVTTSVTSGSSSLVTSGAVYNAINSVINISKTVSLNFLPKYFGGAKDYMDTGLPYSVITNSGTAKNARFGENNPARDSFSTTIFSMNGGKITYTGTSTATYKASSTISGTDGEFVATPQNVLRFFAGGASISSFPDGTYTFTIYTYNARNLARPCDTTGYTTGRTFSVKISDGSVSSTSGGNIQVVNPAYGNTALVVTNFNFVGN